MLKPNEAKQLAEARGEFAVLVFEGKRPRWYMMPSRYGTIEDIAAIAGGEVYETYKAGEVTVLDSKRRPLKDRVPYNWAARMPIRLVIGEPG